MSNWRKRALACSLRPVLFASLHRNIPTVQRQWRFQEHFQTQKGLLWSQWLSWLQGCERRHGVSLLFISPYTPLTFTNTITAVNHYHCLHFPYIYQYYGMSSIFLFQPKHYHLQTLSLSTLHIQSSTLSHIWHLILAPNLALSLMHLSLKLNLCLVQPFPHGKIES